MLDLKTQAKLAVAGGLVVFLLGAGLGSKLGGGKYADGRLSACKDMLNAIMKGAVDQGLVGCVPYKGDVAIKVDDQYFSLEGKKLR